jgi:flagellar biosynthesis/type III secretory pathway ATPase
METTESIALQQQVSELSQRVQVLEQLLAQVIDAQANTQSQIELLQKQSELKIKEQEIQAKRARIALPQLS